MRPAPALVVPLHDEEARFDRGAFEALVAAGFHVLAVDDGSTDQTPALLAGVRGIEVLTLDRNQGKAEAVRHGLTAALARGHDPIGYADADFATPPAELVRLRAELREDVDVVLGARVLLAGRDVRRRRARHYLGRIFATGAANVLRVPFYDTQCGAKWLRVTPALRHALSEPFLTRWAFDVELLGRLLASGVPAGRFREVPLETWIDRGRSKVTHVQKASMLLDLMRIERDLQARRRG